MIENCPMRHENGNCIPAGGFCTANKNICEALLNAYRMGKAQLSHESTISDLISRQAAIDAIHCNIVVTGRENAELVAKTIGEFVDRIKALPTIQPQSTTGQLYDGAQSTAQSTDLINRQALCEYALNQKDKSVTPNDIMRFPPAQPEPQWIPVSERLPEDMQFVLLTVRRLKNGYNPGPFISVGYIGWNHQHWWCAHDGDCEISKVEVLAWMPLPEPYQKGAIK